MKSFEISLSDAKYFSLSIGKRLLKKNIRKFNGTIPIYSANVNVPIGYGSSSNISDFSKDYILWGIDGNFDFNYIKRGNQFITTDHCGAIRILDNKILPEFLMYSLYLVKDNYGFDRGLRASLKNMSGVKVRIPTDENGEFDLDTQMELAKYYGTVRELKLKVSDYVKRLNDVRIDITRNYENISKSSIPDIFDIDLGSSKYDHKYFDKHRGVYPVYSGQTKDNGEIAKIDTFDYECEGITWTIDGYAGRTFHRKGRFSMTTHCGLLRIKQEYLNSLDYEFLAYLLDNILPSYSVGEGNKRLKKTHIMNVSIDIPIDNAGNFDLHTQKKIAQSYKNLERIRSDVIGFLDKLEDTSIKLN
jgi:hypothetical protein